MNEFITQFGIDWKLFVSQLVNFALILVILRFFVYKPILKIIKERNQKIKDGLEKAEEAVLRLKEVDVIGKEKIKEAKTEAINIIKATESRAKELELALQQKREENNARVQKELAESMARQQEEAQNLVLKNALELVKKAVVKTVELSPEKIDEALIKKAAEGISYEK